MAQNTPSSIDPFRLRDVTSEDLPTLLIWNEAEIPHVGSLSLPKLASLFHEAFYFRVAEDAVTGEMGGFVLALDEHSTYSSPNYLWFKQNYPNFIYIDRIIIHPDFRQRGVGRLIYRDLEQRMANRWPVLTCEVNLNPPNPTSIAFHARMGFAQVGTQDTDEGKKTVSLLVKRIVI